MSDKKALGDNGKAGYGSTDVSAVLTPPVVRDLNKRRNSSGKINVDAPPPEHPMKKRQSNEFVRRSSEDRLLNKEDLDFAQQIDKRRSFKGIPDEEEVHDAIDMDDNFVFNHEGMTSDQAAQLLKQWGRNELAEDETPLWYIFVSQLWQPMPIMIWCAALVEALISNWVDMSILLFIQFANASIGFYEITKAGDAVAALKASLKPVATVRRDNKWQVIDAAEVVPGDCVMLASGAAVPADCRLNPKPPNAPKEKAEPNIEVDQAALTGESLPVSMFPNDSVKMGSTCVKGEAEGTVEFTGGNTFFGKTASLLTGSPEISNMQKILIAIVIVLTVLSGVLCTIVFIYLLHKGEELNTALGFTVVLMVASIPMAIEIVTTTTLSLGSKELSDRGAIVTRLTAIEDMAGMNILCSDKTGTLTLNKMVIQDNCPTYVSGETQYSLLRYGAMAARWHEPPKDALDTLILTQVDMPSMAAVEQLDYVPFDPTTKRTEGTVVENGQTFKCSKGAPHIILKLIGDSHNARVIRQAVEDDVLALGMRGIRSLAVAKTDPKTGDWSVLGLLTFLDPPRPDTKQTIIDSKSYGVNVKMITGDHLLIARETARQLEMGTNITDAANLPMLDPDTKAAPPNLVENYGAHCYAHDGFAQVFPEHKYLIVETLRQMGFKTGMTGDGVNDAPALKRADVGIAVQGSTDAARAAADIVLTRPGLSTIVYAIITARKVFVRIRNFITYRVAATLQLLIFFFIATFTMHPDKFEPSKEVTEQYANYPDANMHWPPFFHMPVLMLMLITLLNDGTLIAIGYDNAIPSKNPESWNLPMLYCVGGVLAAVACVSSLLILYLALDSWNPDGVFQQLGMQGLSYGQITTTIYLKVSVSDFLTLFSSRTGEKWFWESTPSKILMVAGCFALTCSTVLACFWPYSFPDGIFAFGLERRVPYLMPVYIWAYCILWWFVQDAAKVLIYYLMKKNNWFGVNDTTADPMLVQELAAASETDALLKKDVESGRH